METPRIQYARSRDGTEIAYAAIGSGPPLLFIDALLSAGLDARLGMPALRPLFETLAAERTIVLFDWRNSGLSGSADRFSVDDVCENIQAVVAQHRLDRFDVVDMVSTLSLEYTVRHPERVGGLAFARPIIGGTNVHNPIISPVAHLLDVDWDAFTRLFALNAYGWTERAREAAASLKAAWTADNLKRFLSVTDAYDALERAKAVECRALVVAQSFFGEYFVRAARALAAALPNGQLRVWNSAELYSADLARLLLDFFLVPESGSEREPPAQASLAPLRVILFTDIEAHTEMMQRLGDAKGRDVLREHERRTREALAAHGGTEVKTMGDGFMASFASAQRALECAVALQRSFESLRTSGGEALRVRVGVNAGEPIAEDDDLFGSSVIIAARTAAQARGGEVLVTDVVRQLVAGKGFLFTDRGETPLRGIEEPLRLHELLWESGASA